MLRLTRTPITIAVVVAYLAVAPIASMARPDAVPQILPHIRPEHRNALVQIMKRRPWFRPASTGDCEDVDCLHEFRTLVSKRGHPFYAVGDVNRDGISDFAILFMDSRRAADSGCGLAIFNGRVGGTWWLAYMELGLEDVKNCYICYGSMIRKRLYLGMYESDMLCATYFPHGTTYRFKDCM